MLHHDLILHLHCSFLLRGVPWLDEARRVRSKESWCFVLTDTSVPRVGRLCRRFGAQKRTRFGIVYIAGFEPRVSKGVEGCILC